MTQSLISQIENRFQTIGQSVSYISADEMAYLQAQARQLRAQASKAWFDSAVTRVAGLFRPASLQSGHAVTVK